MKSRNIKRIKNFLNDDRKKPLSTIISETTKLWIKKGEFPRHYFGRFFYQKDSPSNVSDFLSIKQYNLVIDYLVYKNKQASSIYTILNNKLLFYNFCKENKIPTAEVLSYNLKGVFYYKGNDFKINTTQELQHFFNTVMTDHNVTKLFIKLIEGGGGLGALILDKNKLAEQADSLLKTLKNSSYLHQVLIIQNKSINELYDGAISSLRIETYRDKKNDVHFLGSFLRFGMGNMIVDNISSGGFMVPVDLEKGTLFKSAFSSLVNSAKRHSVHPDTGFVFKDYKLPYFDEIIPLINRISAMLPCTLLGWDIAFTDKGPIVLEGNYSPGLLGPEFSYHGYKNKPVFEEILNDAIAHSKQKNS